MKEARVDNGIRAYCVLTNLYAKRFGFTGKDDHILILPPAVEPPQKYLQIHAGAIETSIMMNYFPEQVNAELAKTLKSTDLTFEDLLEWRQGWSDSRKLTPLGYFGDPASFDPRIGKKHIEDYVKDLAHLIGAFIKGD